MPRKYPTNDIRRLRRTMDPALRQQELADIVGCHRSELSAYERGRVLPRLETAIALATALGRRVEEVFHGLVELARDPVSRVRASSLRDRE